MIDLEERKTLYKKVCENIKTLRPCNLIYDNLNCYYTFYVKPVSIVDEILSDSGSKNSSSPESILSSSSDSASEIFELINSKDIKVIQKNIYNNNMNYIYTELICNLCVSDMILSGINSGFTLLYSYQFKSYNNPFNICKSNNIRKSNSVNDYIKNENFKENNRYLKLLIEHADINLSKLYKKDIVKFNEISIIQQILSSILAYSKFGIIHNDLFPRNILIKIKDNDVLSIISDFGFSLIDRSSQIFNEKKYTSIVDDDIFNHVNLITNNTCNIIIDNISYDNISIYKKDILTILKSISLITKNESIRILCNNIILDIIDTIINSFNELINYIELRLLSKSLNVSVLNGLTI